MAEWYRVFSVSTAEEMYRRLFTLVRNMTLAEAQGLLGPNGIRILARVEKIAKEYQDGLDLVARTTAVEGEKAIHRRITATASGRPRTGRKGLSKAIRCAPLGGAALPTGRVGIGDIGLLNTLTTRGGRMARYGPYWEAQEEGFRPSGKQLKGIRGYFEPGRVAPSPAEFRMQSAFGVQRSGPLMRPSPYPGRFFMLTGSDQALAYYRRELDLLDGRIARELDTLAGAP